MKSMKSFLIALVAIGGFYSSLSLAGSSFSSVGVNVFGIGVQVASGSSSYTPPPPYYGGSYPTYPASGSCGTGACGSHGYYPPPVSTCGQPRPVCTTCMPVPTCGTGTCGGGYGYGMYPYPYPYGNRSFTAVNVAIAPFALGRRVIPVRRGFVPVRRGFKPMPVMRRYY